MSYFTAADAAVEKERKSNNCTNSFISLRNTKQTALNNTNYRYIQTNGCCSLAVRIEACGAKPFLFNKKKSLRAVQKKNRGIKPQKRTAFDNLARLALDPSSNLGSSTARFRTRNPKYVGRFRCAQSPINIIESDAA